MKTGVEILRDVIATALVEMELLFMTKLFMVMAMVEKIMKKIFYQFTTTNKQAL